MSDAKSRDNERRDEAKLVLGDMAESIVKGFDELLDIKPMPFVGELDRGRGVSVTVVRARDDDNDELWLSYVRMIVNHAAVRSDRFYHVFSEGDLPANEASKVMHCDWQRSNWLCECVGDAGEIVRFLDTLDVERIREEGFPLNEVTMFKNNDAVLELRDHGMIVSIYDVSSGDMLLYRRKAPLGSGFEVVTPSH